MNFQDHSELGKASCDRTVANFTGATGLTGLGDGVTAAAGTFTVVNSTTITVTLNLVATPIGTTSTLPFTVN